MDLLLNWVQDEWFSLTLLGGVFTALYKAKRQLEDMHRATEQIGVILPELHDLQEWRETVEEHIKDDEKRNIIAAERNELLLQGMKATLTAQRDGKVNGEVTQALNDIDRYLNRRASE